MIIDLDRWRTQAPEGATASADVKTFLARGLTGGGGFAFDGVCVGIVLRPLASHRARYASDRTKPIPLAAGEGWVFPAGAEGHCDWDGGNDFLTLELHRSALDREALAGLTLGQMGAGALDPLTVSLALQIHAANSADPAAGLYRDTLAGALGAHLARQFAAQTTPRASALEDARLKRARDLIDANLAGPISLQGLADEAGMSPFHFARAFKAATGLAPHQYLIARRIDAAKALLRTTALPVAEIAFRVGWENPSKFSAQFKRTVGATPAAWRNAS